MLNKIKTYALAALGVLTAVFGFLWQYQRAKHENALRKGVENAREIEYDAQDQLNEDLKREAKERENANHSKRDGFE
jgi:Flp pilus assembly protein TadB